VVWMGGKQGLLPGRIGEKRGGGGEVGKEVRKSPIEKEKRGGLFFTERGVNREYRRGMERGTGKLERTTEKKEPALERPGRGGKRISLNKSNHLYLRRTNSCRTI